MKLTADQVEKALDKFDAQAIPENHPAVTELTGLFGEHTFFVDGQGLNIVEPVGRGRRPGNGTRRHSR